MNYIVQPDLRNRAIGHLNELSDLAKKRKCRRSLKKTLKFSHSINRSSKDLNPTSGTSDLSQSGPKWVLVKIGKYYYYSTTIQDFSTFFLVISHSYLDLENMVTMYYVLNKVGE